MSRNDSNAGAETPPVDYAFWDIPGCGPAGEPFKVIYSLHLFHEIDFVVNEGYRKIPHGGIETAGLLFGSVDKEELRIEAFRPIDCEHSAGPSLHFSERDLTALEEQIQVSGLEPELHKWRPIGWFLGHTRGPLELTEAEARQFDRFFPEPCRLTVIVKPERFQPTRFGFLVRKANGDVPRDASASAVILPLPGRSFKPGQLVESIPAPNPIASPKRPAPASPPPPRKAPAAPIAADFEPEVPELEPKPVVKAQPPPPPKRALDPELASIWKIAPDLEPDLHSPIEQDVSPEPNAASREQHRKLARERARLIEEAYPAPAPLPSAPLPASPVLPPLPVPFRPAALPSLPMDAARPIPSAYDRLPALASPYYDEDEAESSSVFSARSLTTLALSALLGCLVGYIAYLQLPPPVIPIDVHSLDRTILISWPPDTTRSAVYAAIRLNDAAPVPLSADEKKAGHFSLPAAQDFKIEIVAHNWIRDSRGIVRYLHSNNGNGQVVPTDTSPAP